MGSPSGTERKYANQVLLAKVVATGGSEARSLADWMAHLEGSAIEAPLRAESFQSSNPAGGQSIVYAGANSRDNSWLWGELSLSGTLTSDVVFGARSVAGIRIFPDTANVASGLAYFEVNARPGTGRIGNRTGVLGRLICNSVVDASDTYAGLVGVMGVVGVAANQNGTGVSLTTHKGNVFGGNSNAYTASGATFLALINGHEFNTTLVTGASAAQKFGISIVKGVSDAVRGSYSDAALAISDQGGAAVGWTVGLQFGSYAGQWAFGTDSTLIGVKNQVLPAPDTSEALYGIDMSALTITAGGAGVVMPLISPASAAATGKAGSICWDAGFIYVCTATDTWKRVAIATWP